ncbi:MAG: hypothetical protein VB062_08000 [Christensenella sp.]|nr:hypothetical protein [Christensenella sp.]
MKHSGKALRRWLVSGGVLIFVALVAGVILATLSSRAKLLPSLSFAECLAYTTKGKENARIAVAVIQIRKTIADRVILHSAGHQSQIHFSSLKQNPGAALLRGQPIDKVLRTLPMGFTLG